jgi:hypothetical protein
MAEKISQVERPSNAALWEKMYHRRMVKQNLKDKINEANEVAEIAKQEDMDEALLFQAADNEYFAVGEEQTNNFIQYAVLGNQANIAPSDSSDILNNAGIQYLLQDEIDSFIDSFDQIKNKKEQFKTLAEKIANSPEGTEEDVLDAGVKLLCSSKAETYILLLYVQEFLRQRNSREKFFERISQIKDEFEKQENGYLFEFFSIQKMVESLNNSNINNAKFIDQMAQVSSGQVSLESLKQTLEFVRGLFGDNFHKMVSVFMKIRSMQLKKIKSEFLSPEERSELVNMLRQENQIIILNSVYNQSKKSLEKLKKMGPVQEKYGELIAQLIALTESMFISADSVVGISKILGLDQADKKSLNTLLSEMIRIYTVAPVAIFNNQANRMKTLDSLRAVTTKISPEQKETKQLSFLKSRNKTIKFV